MSISKDKRIKKLKKKRIWPSILGLVIVLLFLSVIVSLVFGFSGLDILQRKINNSSIQTAKIAKLYESLDGEAITKLNEAVSTYISLTPEVRSICLKDKENHKVWSSDGTYPDVENVTYYDIEREDMKLRMMIGNDKDGIFVVEDDEIEFSEEFYLKLDDSAFGDKLLWAFIFDEQNEALYEFDLWYEIATEQGYIYICNNIQLYMSDLFMLLVAVILFAIIMAVFTIYYLVSFISVIISMRKTTKILYTDMITGGNNWIYFVKRGSALLRKNRGNRKRYVMLHLRMYKYRSFCTCFGVQEGEALLEKFYLALKKQVKKKEVMAYHENAEFGLLITYTDDAQLLGRIDELKKALCATLPNMKLYFGVGACLVATGEKDVEKLYNNATLACDIRGEETDDQIAFFDVEMNKQKLWERKVEDDMDRALLNKEFKVYLQPKISATNEVLAGAEALVRWIHPTEGFIPPGKFIPIFERNGFVLKLDDYMLEEVARLQAQWIAEGRKIVPISVNVSRAHFSREDLAEHICGIVDKYQVPHDIIELELTESAFFEEKELLLNTVRKLRESGFAVSMDDFGAGYSSLNSLKELQLDVLKIDADFFRGDNVEERGMLIVSEVIDLAKKLNMKIVAEGIESREQVDFLIEQECDLIQGYFFAKPMAIEEFVAKY